MGESMVLHKVRKVGARGWVGLLLGSFVALSSIALLASVAEAAEPAAAKPLLQYLYEWGEPGTGTAQFRALRGIVAYDRKESGRTLVVVSDTGLDMVRSYTWDMMFIDKWGSEGDRPGQFRQPRGVAIDKDGNLLVVDSFNHRVQKTVVGTKTFLDRPGAPIQTFGSRGSGNGQFETPTGVEVDSAGNIYVVDTENHRVQKFDGAGKFLKTWGRRGSGNDAFDRPTHVAIDGAGRVYVSDTGNHRVQVFDGEGQYLSTVGKIGSTPGRFAEPKGLAIDAKGNLWVVDRRNHRLQAFGPDGRNLGTYGRQGPGKGEFSFPEDMAFDSSGRLYVTDGMNGRIQVFKPT